MENLIDAIKCRHSVRTYAGMPLTADAERRIQNMIDNMSNPFGRNPTVRLVRVDPLGQQHPGTYGMISHACNYLLMGYGDNFADMLAAGFAMQRVVLEATAIGLGTCWMGGTFRNDSFARLADFPAGTPLKIILPIGTPADKPRLLEKVGRRMMRSASRKPFGQLFFNGNFSTPLVPDGSMLSLALEMMRLAPSALNAQPWRAVVIGKKVEFYAAPGKFSIIDCGIALSHFSLTIDQCGGKGAWHGGSYASGEAGFIHIATFEMS